MTSDNILSQFVTQPQSKEQSGMEISLNSHGIETLVQPLVSLFSVNPHDSTQDLSFCSLSSPLTTNSDVSVSFLKPDAQKIVFKIIFYSQTPKFPWVDSEKSPFVNFPTSIEKYINFPTKQEEPNKFNGTNGISTIVIHASLSPATLNSSQKTSQQISIHTQYPNLHQTPQSRLHTISLHILQSYFSQVNIEDFISAWYASGSTTSSASGGSPLTLNSSNVLEILLDELPKKWEKLGSYAILDPKSFSSGLCYFLDQYSRQNTLFLPMQLIYQQICIIIQVSNLALQDAIATDLIRSSQVKTLYSISKDFSLDLTTTLIKHPKLTPGQFLAGDFSQFCVQYTIPISLSPSTASTGGILNVDQTTKMTDDLLVLLRQTVVQYLTLKDQLCLFEPEILPQSKNDVISKEILSQNWSWHSENQLKYCIEVTKSMFSSGNTTEKYRISKIALPLSQSQVSSFSVSSLDLTAGLERETVADLYCGIGYFSLPLLAHSHISHLYATELNPWSVTAFRRALDYNSKYFTGKNKSIPFLQRCTIVPGDNRRPEVKIALRNVADRVSLGLIPTAEDGLSTAIIALKPRGGVLHVHMNIKKGLEHEWAITTLLPTITKLISNLTQMSISPHHLQESSLSPLGMADLQTYDLVPEAHSLLDSIQTIINQERYTVSQDVHSSLNDRHTIYSKPSATAPGSFQDPLNLQHQPVLSADDLQQLFPSNIRTYPGEGLRYGLGSIPSGKLFEDEKQRWKSRLLHIEVVKSYAPHILHVVYDVALGTPEVLDGLQIPALAKAFVRNQITITE